MYIRLISTTLVQNTTKILMRPESGVTPKGSVDDWSIESVRLAKTNKCRVVSYIDFKYNCIVVVVWFL